VADHPFDEEEFKTQYDGKIILRIISLLKKHWKRTAGFLILISLVSVQDAFFAFINKLIIDDGILAGNTVRLTQLLITYAIMAFFQAAFVFGFINMAGMLGENLQYDLRKKMFNHLQDLSFSYYNKTPVGWIMTRVTSDSAKIAELVTWSMVDITWSLLNVTTAMIFMLIINWKLALIIIGIIPIMVFIAVKFQKHILDHFRKVRKMNSQITGVYNETITGIRIVKALCREEQNLAEFSEKTYAMYKSSYKAAWLSALFLPLIQILTSLALSAIIVFGGVQQLKGNISIGSIQAFITYVAFMMWPIQQMARVWASMQSSLASAERVFSLVDAVPEIVDKQGAYDPGSLEKEITFQNVTFGYEDKKPVLEDFNLTVAKGTSLALVGHTGCGKTTIVNLLCRFYEPQKGEICFDGVDYRNFTQHSIQSRIGIVLQVPQLFSGTIRENIRYGRLDAPDAEIEEAARLAMAHNFIMKLSKGYDEEVGEGGLLLSVGQRQLISLSRAWLANPDLFIMDEATSSIDTITEKSIQQAQEVIFRKKTSIVIAHRLSTVKKADRIIVLDHGRIIEQGNHQSLMEQQGKYYSLYSRATNPDNNRGELNA